MDLVAGDEFLPFVGPSAFAAGAGRADKELIRVTRYLISFDEGAMTFPEEELPAVADDVHAVVHEAMDAGVWVSGGGLFPHEELSVVATDGTVTDAPYPEGKAYIAGFSIVDGSSRAESFEWAGKFAVACRCAQDVREFLPDPALGN